MQAAGRTKVLQEELVDQSRRLEALLFEDPLTGLSNRRFILTQLAGLVSGARRHGRPLAVAMIDIDHFKAINDRHGHAAGDQVLAGWPPRCAATCAPRTSSGASAARSSSPCCPTGRGRRRVAAEKLRAEVAAERVEHERPRLGVTISVGWAAWEGETAEELLRRADDALYEAKRPRPRSGQRCSC